MREELTSNQRISQRATQNGLECCREVLWVRHSGSKETQPSLNPGLAAYSRVLWQRLLTLWMPGPPLTSPEALGTGSGPLTASHSHQLPFWYSGLLHWPGSLSPLVLWETGAILSHRRGGQWINTSTSLSANGTILRECICFLCCCEKLPHTPHSVVWNNTHLWSDSFVNPKTGMGLTQLDQGASRVHSFLEALEENFVSLPFPAPRRLLFSLICGSLFHLHSQQHWAESFSHHHLSSSLLTPSFTKKDPCEYTGSSQIF